MKQLLDLIEQNIITKKQAGIILLESIITDKPISEILITGVVVDGVIYVEPIMNDKKI